MNERISGGPELLVRAVRTGICCWMHASVHQNQPARPESSVDAYGPWEWLILIIDNILDMRCNLFCEMHRTRTAHPPRNLVVHDGHVAPNIVEQLATEREIQTE